MARDNSDLPAGMARAWAPSPLPRRGPRPAHSVPKIIDAALALADSRGLASVSLHHVAAELGVATNTLYGYVGSKEELLVLLQDAALDPSPSDLPKSQGWRRFAAAWTKSLADRFRRHPWLLDIPVRGAPMTPAPLRWLELLLQELDAAGLTDSEQFGCALLLESQARNIVRLERDLSAAAESAGGQLPSAAGQFLMAQLADGDFPRLSAIMAVGDYGTASTPPKRETDFGLERILDGIEVLVAASSADRRTG